MCNENNCTYESIDDTNRERFRRAEDSASRLEAHERMLEQKNQDLRGWLYEIT